MAAPKEIDATPFKATNLKHFMCFVFYNKPVLSELDLESELDYNSQIL